MAESEPVIAGIAESGIAEDSSSVRNRHLAFPLLRKRGVVQALVRLRESELALLVGEQNVRFLDLADRVYTLDNGRIGFAGTVRMMHENHAPPRLFPT
jgi:ABC-type branched-subunit amino acid transport system ATPase component